MLVLEQGYLDDANVKSMLYFLLYYQAAYASPGLNRSAVLRLLRAPRNEQITLTTFFLSGVEVATVDT